MTLGLTPTYFDGTAIQGATYHSSFLAEHDVLSAPDVEPIEVGIPGGYPESPGSQPQSRVIPLYVELSTQTQTALNNFKKLFDADKGDCILKAQDGDANDWRLTVRVMGTPNFNKVARAWVVRLYAPRPIWEQDSQQSDVQTITTSPATWQVTNAGTKKCYPVIQLKPTAAKAHTADYLRRWPVSIASRTEQEMLSGDGLPYPIDLANDALDTATEIGASRMQADGDDLRAIIDGVEVRRDLDGINGASTKVWSSASWKPKLTAVLGQAMTAGSPANGESITLASELSPAWPQKGFVVFGTERIYYGARTSSAFQQILRASRGTTAASHSAADVGYWVQHDIYLLSDYTAATEPNGSDVDRKPMIDLALSSNVKHAGWPDGFTAPGTLRPGQALRRYTNDNLLSPAISFLDGATPAFRDIAPSAAAPQFNGLEFVVPCGIKAAAGAIEHDVTVQDILALEVYGVDTEGFASLLQRYNSGNDGANVTLTPSAVLSRLRYVVNSVMVTGADTDDAANETVGLTEKAQQFTLDQDTEIWALLLRLKKTTAPDGNVEVRIRADANGVPSGRIGPEFTLAASGLAATYADYIFRWVTLAGNYILLSAGTYWLAVNRSVDTGGSVEWSFSASQLYSKGLFYGAAAAGSSPEGPNSPDSGTDLAGIGTVAWTNPDRVVASDDSWATASVGAGLITHYLKAVDYDFAIPDDAEIQGILVEFERFDGGSPKRMHDESIRLVKGGVIVGENRARASEDWPDSDAYSSYGGPTDLWGETWTPADINAAVFGAVFACKNTYSAGSTPSIDHVRVTVYYGASQYQTAHFGILSRPQATLQPEAPSGSAHTVTLDNIEFTLDDATPRTPLIVRGAQETIYAFTEDVLSNEDTGQSITFQRPILALNDVLKIDPYNKRIQLIPTNAADPTLDIPWACMFSDEIDWFTLLAGATNLRYVAGQGIGTIELTLTWRGVWA